MSEDMSGKYALIIANTEYNDQGLAKLNAPGKDAEEFWRVLNSPDIGAFDDVMLLLNQDSSKVNERIEYFFSKKKPDDLLVLYFSGHGVRDEYGSLYLAVKNTDRDFLNSTAISSSFIRQLMDRSRSKRQVLILDCCNSGAFEQGTKAAAGVSIGTATAFEVGYGRVILTASDATQYAWEGDQVIGETENSLFTHYLVEGLEGKADRDGDGRITVDELYDYAYEKVKLATPKQTPSKFSSKEQGEILLRESMRLEDIRPVPLSADLLDEIEDTRPYVRGEAVKKLEKILKGKNIGLARSAREALEKIAVDENTTRGVAQAATQILESIREKEQLALQQTEAMPLTAEKAKAEQEVKAKEEAERLAAQKTEEERIAKAKAKADRKAKEEAKRLAAQKAEEERVAKAKREAARLAEEKRRAEEKAEAEQKVKEEAERSFRNKVEKELPTPAQIQQPNVNKAISAESKPAAKPRLPFIVIVGAAILTLVICSSLISWLSTPTLSPAEETQSAIADTEAAMAQGTEAYVAQVTGTAEAQAAQTQIAIPTVTVQAREAYIQSLASKAQLIFGPESGKLEHVADSTKISGLLGPPQDISDFIVTATFRNPYAMEAGDWNYGFIFRATENDGYQLFIDSNKRWNVIHTGLDKIIGSGNLTNVAIDTGENGTNRIAVYCNGSKGWLYINDVFISELDLGGNMNPGFIYIATGFLTNDQKSGYATGYENFLVKEIP